MGILPLMLLVLLRAPDDFYLHLNYFLFPVYFFIFALIWGKKGNTWHRESLEKKSCLLLNSFEAESTKEALHKAKEIEGEHSLARKQEEQNREEQAEKERQKRDEERLKKADEERMRLQNLPKLINCPDCNRKISRRAAACPQCGAPIREQAGATQPPAPSTVAIVKCPTCQSTDVERISTAKKTTYVVAVGVLAPAFKKVRSQFECKQCGYKW